MEFRPTEFQAQKPLTVSPLGFSCHVFVLPTWNSEYHLEFLYFSYNIFHTSRFGIFGDTCTSLRKFDFFIPLHEIPSLRNLWSPGFSYVMHTNILSHGMHLDFPCDHFPCNQFPDFCKILASPAISQVLYIYNI